MKKTLRLLFIALMIFSLVSCVADNRKISEEVNKQTSKTTESKENKSSAEKVPYTRYKINEVGKTGGYQLKTVKYSETAEISLTREKFKTTNKYIIVDIEIAANDKTLEFGYSPNDFMLADSENKTYSTCDVTNNLNVENEEKDKNYIGIFKSLNPDVFKKTQIVFEVSKDIKPLLLVNKNEGSTTYVEFELQ